MASIKITVDELRFKKTIYSKAAKNLRDVIAVVKKARSSIGNDRMFNEARQSLGKLAELLDRRATVLEALAEALIYSTDTYKTAQTHSVSQISEYKAHKKDFYGNPVHVSGAAAAAGGVAAAASSGTSHTSASSGVTSSGTSQPAGASSSSGSTGSTASGGTQNTPVNVDVQNSVQSSAADVAPTASAQTMSENYTDNSTVNITNNTVVNNITENVYIQEADSAASGISAETVSATNTVASAPMPSASGSTESTGVNGAAMFGAGIAAAAVSGAATFGVSKVLKKKKEDNSLDHRIEEAKKKLQAIEEELESSATEDVEDEVENR
ncbi:MAG: hypothetical protein IKP88_20410 [Lachnospiraceae bacterium]|nr:hypothetical protein [Lachnospiraceae bacterium]